MPVARIFDPAGDTIDFFYITGVPELTKFKDDLLTLEARILEGANAGKTLKIEWLGEFDLEAGEGSVLEWRESLGGNLHFSLDFEAPVALEDIFLGLEDLFTEGFAFRGNRFGNVFRADATDDRLLGLGGDDFLFGLGGDDRIFGGAGLDSLFGGGGDDVLRDDSGTNTLVGGAGDDRLDARGSAEYQLRGGKGDDTYLVDASDSFLSAVIEKKSGGHDTVLARALSYALPDQVEDLRMLGRFDEVVTAEGNKLDNVVQGTKGADSIDGGFGGDDVLFGGGGRDALAALGGKDEVFGGRGDDILSAIRGKGAFYGGSGDDLFQVASVGADRLTGGGGRDEFFIFMASAAAGLDGKARDVLVDFQSDRDIINLGEIVQFFAKDAMMDFIGDLDFSGDRAEIRYNGHVLTGDVDADTVVDFSIEIANGAELTDASFGF